LETLFVDLFTLGYQLKRKKEIRGKPQEDDENYPNLPNEIKTLTISNPFMPIS
jgi:hypothetical protein